MRRTVVEGPINGHFAPVAGAAAIVLLGAISTLGQVSTTDKPGRHPRLPEAVTKAPDWFGPVAPFDVAKFFAAPPLERNAAPLYLDALFEFGAEMNVCFPEGRERERRLQAAEDRQKRYMEVIQPLHDKTKSASPAQVDEVIKLYHVGFRKLAEAQRLEHCVFETGIGIASPLPHIQASRQVVRIAALRVQRAVQRGEFDMAISDVETALRLSRDLQPRGFVVCQLVAAALAQVVGVTMVPAILADPGLKAEHCDRLLKVLAAHDAKSIDPYVEATRSEYVMIRSLLRDIVRNQPELAKSMGLKPGESVVRGLLAQVGRMPAPPPGPTVSGKSARRPVDDWDKRVAQTSPTEQDRRRRQVDRYYRVLLGLDGLPCSARLEKIAALSTLEGSDPLSLVLQAMIQPAAMASFLNASANATATLRANECLVALRRRRLSRRGLPPDLASIVEGSALKAVPIDPFDGKPMRLTVLDGEPVVYSVGRDGKDDGAKKESKWNDPPGDLIYRLPAVEERREIRPVNHRRSESSRSASHRSLTGPLPRRFI